MISIFPDSIADLHRMPTVADTLQGNLKMSFSVVEFTEDYSVYVVSSSWIVNGMCSWPPYRVASLRFLSAIKKHETPADSWMTYHCRVLHCYG